MENDLQDYFSQAGIISSVNLMMDKFTGKSRGFAFIEYSSAGDATKAVEMFHMLNPINHTRTRADVDRYKVEPYVVAADVYTHPAHIGRGGWTWYTGSAGWMYRVAIESVLGLRVVRGERLRIQPCIPDDWPGFTAHYTVPGTDARYVIVVENPERCAETVLAVTSDAEQHRLEDGAALVSLARDGAHSVVVRVGRNLAP